MGIGGRKRTRRAVRPPLMILAPAMLGTRGMRERLAVGERAATEDKAVWREEEEEEKVVVEGGMMSMMMMVNYLAT